METKFQPDLKKSNISEYIYIYSGVMLLFVIVGFFSPDKVEDFGAWTAIPALFLIVYIFITKRILESLTLASVPRLFHVFQDRLVFGVQHCLAWMC